MGMELIDNVHKTLRDNLKDVMQAGSKISIAAPSFSIYAFQSDYSKNAGFESAA